MAVRDITDEQLRDLRVVVDLGVFQDAEYRRDIVAEYLARLTIKERRELYREMVVGNE